MKNNCKSFVALVTVAVGMVAGPAQSQTKPKINPPPAIQVNSTPAVTSDEIPTALQGIKELVKSTQYFVTLEFRKSTFSLDPFEAIFSAVENELAKKEETFEVGQMTYDSYRINQELSSKDDVLGFLLSDSFAFSSYNVTVIAKKSKESYGRVTQANTLVEILKPEYDRLSSLARINLPNRITSSSHNGVERLTILKQPLEELNVASITPLKRHFVKLEIANSTFTFDIFKHIRNAMLSHEIDIEVTQQQYHNPSNRMWEPHLGFSFFVTGRLSQMEGTVIQRWTTTDPKFVEVLLDDGSKMVMTVAESKRLQN